MSSTRCRHRIVSTLLALFALSTLLPACMRIDEYVRPSYVVQAVYPVSPAVCPRILLLPPACDHCTPEELATLTESFRAELVKAGYSVPAPKPTSVPAAYTAPADPATLRQIAQSAGVDAILVLRVREYRPYRPPILDLDAAVYTVGVPGAAWQLHGVWDPRDGNVAARLEQFARNEIEPSVSRLGHSAVLYSPHVFLRFVAHEVVTAMTGGELVTGQLDDDGAAARSPDTSGEPVE